MSAAVFSEPSEPHRRLDAPVSIPRERLLGRAGTPPASDDIASPPSAPTADDSRVRVRLLAWGLTQGHAETAARYAESKASRASWEFAQVEQATSDACPIDITDPKAIAADLGPGWAYAVYPVGTEDA